mmetsp:Transcript_48608/g.86380  ORF Transcript_48608/g.86380 Transcript_48608/m.86380 type:complete len:209 (+) Transcript_48608:571-1197(+)
MSSSLKKCLFTPDHVAERGNTSLLLLVSVKQMLFIGRANVANLVHVHSLLCCQLLTRLENLLVVLSNALVCLFFCLVPSQHSGMCEWIVYFTLSRGSVQDHALRGCVESCHSRIAWKWRSVYSSELITEVRILRSFGSHGPYMLNSRSALPASITQSACPSSSSCRPGSGQWTTGTAERVTISQFHCLCLPQILQHELILRRECECWS